MFFRHPLVPCCACLQPANMLKYLRKVEVAEDELVEELNEVAATEMAAQKVKKARGQTPWASWPREKKEEIAKEALKGS